MSEPTSPPSFAVLWDVDGTLVDTADLHFQAWQRLATQRGFAFTRADFTATFGRRNPEILRELFGAGISDSDIARLGDEKEDLYRAEAGKGVTLLPGVRSLLEGLQAAGAVQALASSAPRQNVELIIRLNQIEPFFSALVGMEDTSKGKPDPEVFLTAAKKVAFPPERCVVLEDAVAGVQAARAGGMKCVAVSFVGHHSADALRQAGANLVVPSLEQVTAQDLQKLLFDRLSSCWRIAYIRILK